MSDPQAVPSRSSPPAALWVFGILLASYAYFWHGRDWNSASRLMLTYAMVDRGTIVLDGLQDQTGDKARFQGHFYTDKLPGFPLLAAPVYAGAKAILRLPDHPLDRKGFAFWSPDYWVTLGTSGLLTACTGALLAAMARDLGCGPRRAALVGLAYGLATPAYVYGTMAYGHQASAFALLAAFRLLWKPWARRAGLGAGLAGVLAAYGSVIELQMGPVSAILGLYCLALVSGRKLPLSALGAFGVGALGPTLVLLAYNQLAFGSPWDMGYFHHATRRFAEVHSTQNPLGLRTPHWERAALLLFGSYRGLLFYAPILGLAAPGWAALLARKMWGMAIVTAGICAAVFLVNLSYPEWTGGWSTGPRLLVPLIPFAMLPVAALLGAAGRWATGLALALALWGGVVMVLFQGVGGRIPDQVFLRGDPVPLSDPLGSAVWPLWRGAPLPGWKTDGRFTRNLATRLAPGAVERLPEDLRGIQFVPLVAGQAVAIAAMLLVGLRSGPRHGHPPPVSEPPGSGA
jgi:hypothetical protein